MRPKKLTRCFKPCSPKPFSARFRPSQRLLNKAESFRGKKRIHHHCGTPLFSVCRLTPRSSQSRKKSHGVYHFPRKTRHKGIHHRSRKKGILYTVEPQTRKKKKNRRVFTVVVHLVTRPKYPPLSRDKWSNTPVALCFLWYRRLSLLHPHSCP